MKRITIFSGHFGSGKTNLSVNFAINLAKQKLNVTIYDMDIVNPYYRTADANEILTENGVKIVASDFASSNVDLPSINASAYKMTADKSSYAVVDVGGDEQGALALGRYREAILSENDYDFVFVLNKFRPMTNTLEQAYEVFSNIETVSGIKFTSIASNGNLGAETTFQDIVEGLNFSEEFSKMVNIPIAFVGISENTEAEKIENAIRMQLIKYVDF